MNIDVDIKANLEPSRRVSRAACRSAGRAPGEVLLIAVSKTVDVERIRAAVAAGAAALGENRVQEAKDKVAALGRPVPWHLIGSLQTNKARDAASSSTGSTRWIGSSWRGSSTGAPTRWGAKCGGSSR